MYLFSPGNETDGPRMELKKTERTFLKSIKKEFAFEKLFIMMRGDNVENRNHKQKKGRGEILFVNYDIEEIKKYYRGKVQNSEN